MVKLYNYDEQKRAWVLVDYGILSRVREYVLQGYVVMYPRGRKQQKAPITDIAA